MSIPNQSQFIQRLMAGRGLEIGGVVLACAFLAFLLVRARGYRIGLLPFLIIMLFPVDVLYFNVGFHLYYHRTLLIVYFILFLIKISSRSGEGNKVMNMTTVAALLFVVFSLTGLVTCSDYGLFFRYWLAFLSGVALYVCLLYDTVNLDRVEGLVFACITSGFIWAAVGLVIFVLGNGSIAHGDVNTMTRLGILYGDSNYFASFLVCFMQLSFFWFIKKGNKGRLFSLVAYLTMGLALVFTYSRGGYLGFCVILLLNLFFVMKYGHKLSSLLHVGRAFCVLFVLIGVMLGLLLTMSTLGDRVKSITEDKTGGSHRLYIWADMLKVAAENPFGVGLGNIRIYTIKHRSQYPTAGSVAHNIFLNVLVETGYFAFLIYLFFLGSYYSRAVYLVRIKDRDILFWFSGALIGLVGIFCTQYFLSSVYDELVFVQIALFLSIFDLHRRSVRSQKAAFLRQRLHRAN